MPTGRLDLLLVFGALLCATASCRTLTSDDSAAFGSELPTRALSILLSSLSNPPTNNLDGVMCDAECNDKESTGGPCIGFFAGLCKSKSEGPEVNTTGVRKFGCIGTWSGINTSTIEEEVNFQCDGFYATTDLLHSSTSNETYISMYHYGCSLAYKHKSKANNSTLTEFSSCRGADIRKGKNISKIKDGNTKAVLSLGNLEELMNEFSADSDPFSFDLTQYDGPSEAGLGSAMKHSSEASIKCNGKKAKIDKKCKGKIELHFKGSNISVSEECDGKWEPIDKETFSCDGSWTSKSKGNYLESKFKTLSNCEGSAGVGGTIKQHHKRMTTEYTELCYGFSTMHEETKTSQADYRRIPIN